MPPAPPSGPKAPPRPSHSRPARASRSHGRLEALLSDLGPQIRRANEIHHDSATHALLPTGLEGIDRLLGGGFARGRLSEIAGPASSGRTSLALALLSHTTRAGEFTAVVDPADAFDPPSAESAGAHLDHVLWARARTWHEALRCTHRLLETDGFPLVLLDLPLAGRGHPKTGQNPSAATTSWLQLSRLAAGTRTALVVLSNERCTGSHAEIALEMQPSRPRFSGRPALLEELEIHAELVRHRARPVWQTAPLQHTSELKWQEQ